MMKHIEEKNCCESVIELISYFNPLWAGFEEIHKSFRGLFQRPEIISPFLFNPFGFFFR
jgi:hypothetical protein